MTADRAEESVGRPEGAASARSFAIIPGRGHACAGPADREDGWSTTDPSWPTRGRAPIGSGHSRDESATRSARLTVVRGRSENMTMQKRREGSTLCLLATRFREPDSYSEAMWLTN